MRTLLTHALLGLSIACLLAAAAYADDDTRAEWVLEMADDVRQQHVAVGFWGARDGVQIRVADGGATEVSDAGSTSGTMSVPATVLGCVLACPELVDGLAALGLVVDITRFTLFYTSDSRLQYRIGTLETRGSVALEIERDTYQLRGVHWIDSDGRPGSIEVLEITGGQPQRLRVTSGQTDVELVYLGDDS